MPSINCGRGNSIDGFDLGTGGGVCILFSTRGTLSLGSGGSVKLRRGLGDLTGGGEFLTTTEGADGGCVGVTGRFCSNILTRELVGGIGVSSVGLSCRAALAADFEPILLLLLSGCWLALCWLGFCCSSLANTSPTLPDGGSTSCSFACLSLIITATLALGAGRRGLRRAAANLAAVYDGDGARSTWLSGTPRELELLTCWGAACGLLTLRELPPV